MKLFKVFTILLVFALVQGRPFLLPMMVARLLGFGGNAATTATTSQQAHKSTNPQDPTPQNVPQRISSPKTSHPAYDANPRVAANQIAIPPFGKQSVATQESVPVSSRLPSADLIIALHDVQKALNRIASAHVTAITKDGTPIQRRLRRSLQQNSYADGVVFIQPVYF